MTSGANFLKSRQPSLYHDLVSDNSHQIWDEIIQNDLNRTFPDNIYFVPSTDGKLNSLYNILRASARHNTSVGYCQVILCSLPLCILIIIVVYTIFLGVKLCSRIVVNSNKR